MKTGNLTFLRWKTLMVVLLSTFFIFSCSKKDKDTPAPDPGGTGTGDSTGNGSGTATVKDTMVHVLGLVNDGSNVDINFWVNDADSVETLGSRTESDPNNATNVVDIATYNNDVYMIGAYFGGTSMQIAYFKNGVKHDITDGTVSAGAGGIAIADDGTIYISGDEAEQSGFMTAKIWVVHTDGSKDTIVLSDDYNQYAHGIALDDNDNIYVAGLRGGSEAGYWTYDGTNITFDTLAQGGFEPSLIEVDNNGKVYLAGIDHSDASINYMDDEGNLHQLSDQGEVNGMSLHDGDVYVVGYTREQAGNKFSATFWKNGDATYLTDGSKSAVANAITFFGDDVYVAGAEKLEETPSPTNNYVAMYWKNDASSKVELTNGDHDAQPFIINVTEE